MAQFTGIPYEVVGRITSFIPRSNLPILCLVNSSLRGHAERSLYSTITLEWDDIYPLIPLLGTLLRRPEIFAYVRTVSLSMGGHGVVGSEAPSVEASDIPLEQFTSAIRKTQVPFTNLWVDKLNDGSVDALVGLLIAHLSNVNKLSLDHFFGDHLDVIDKVLQSKAFDHILPKFRQLQHISYLKWAEYMKNEHDILFNDSISIFYLQTLESIAVWIVNPSIFRWPAEKPNLDHLTSLEIHWLRAPFLAEILALTTNLRSLTWEWQYRPDTGDSWITPNLDLDEVSEALSHVKNTLEKLKINAYEGDYPPGYDGPDVSMSGSLSGLLECNRITDLILPLVCLAGLGPTPLPLDRYVPSSVETISLTSYMLLDRSLAKWYPETWQFLDLEIIKMIQAFAENSRMRLSRLRLMNIVETEDAFQSTDIHAKLRKLSLWFKTRYIYDG
ncbi:unnamed protein product [Clonostachys rosea]|uniref:F-box domain-containing protein n=1 Tax=Bionectria ochroleuca TaxID=29856 RepID=A0ABY6UPL3_BIOOC|nr:unnamed protein product [Clonostachys rosea]